MKTAFTMMLALSASMSAMGAMSPFRPNSVVPLSLRDEVLIAIDKQCPEVSSVNEIVTSVREIQIDQGQSDLHFTSTFKAVRRTSPWIETITVESVMADISNPSVKATEVLSVQCL